MPAASTASFPTSRILARAKEILASLARHLVVVQEDAPPDSAENPWQYYWGSAYGPDLKQWLLKPVFEELERAGNLGALIVDAGSGAVPVTDFLPARPGRKRILVDIAADNACSANEQRIRLDAEKVGDPAALSFRKALVRASRFLGTDPKATLPARADTVVFSDLLNYIDFRKVLRSFSTFLKPGGRFVIVNLPIRGNQSLFSDKGLKDNRDLVAYLESNHFEIEQKSFPKRGRNETDESGELIILVARKRFGTQSKANYSDDLKLTFAES